MSRHAIVLAAVALLCPSVCNAGTCKAEESQHEETSLVQIKSSVNRGSQRPELHAGGYGSRRQGGYDGYERSSGQSQRPQRRPAASSRLSAFGSRSSGHPLASQHDGHSFASSESPSLDSLGSQAALKSPRAYQGYDSHARPTLSHDDRFSGPSSTHGDRFSASSSAPHDDGFSQKAHEGLPQEQPPGPDFADMLGGTSAAGASTLGMSDTSMDMMSAGDAEYVARQNAKSKEFVDREQYQKNAYEEAAAAEQAAYAKHEQDQKDWYINRTDGAKKWYEDQQVGAKEYVKKEQMAVQSYLHGQAAAASMVMGAKRKAMAAIETRPGVVPDS